MEESRILIGTPCFGSMCHSHYTSSLVQTIKKYPDNIDILFINNQIVTRGRNMLLKQFLKNKEYTHLLFIDSDIDWNPEDIEKLVNHRKDVVGGFYPCKDYIWQRLASINGLFEPPMLNRYITNYEKFERDENGLVSVRHIGTGFLLLSRKCLEDLCEYHSELKYIDDNGEENYALFDTAVVNKEYLTEDYMFCHLWKRTGGSIYGDPTIKLNHSGVHRFLGDIEKIHPPEDNITACTNLEGPIGNE